MAPKEGSDTKGEEQSEEDMGSRWAREVRTPANLHHICWTFAAPCLRCPNTGKQGEALQYTERCRSNKTYDQIQLEESLRQLATEVHA